jgi:hypothetical protein
MHKGFVELHNTLELDTIGGNLASSAPTRKKSDAPAGGRSGKS